MLLLPPDDDNDDDDDEVVSIDDSVEMIIDIVMLIPHYYLFESKFLRFGQLPSSMRNGLAMTSSWLLP